MEFWDERRRVSGRLVRSSLWAGISLIHSSMVRVNRVWKVLGTSNLLQREVMDGISLIRNVMASGSLHRNKWSKVAGCKWQCVHIGSCHVCPPDFVLRSGEANWLYTNFVKWLEDECLYDRTACRNHCHWMSSKVAWVHWCFFGGNCRVPEVLLLRGMLIYIVSEWLTCRCVPYICWLVGRARLGWSRCIF